MRNRAVYILDLAAGLVSLEELRDFLSLGETDQIELCKEAGFYPLDAVTHAIRWSSSLASGYSQFGEFIKEFMWSRYFINELYGGEEATLICTWAAYFLARIEPVPDFECLQLICKHADWRQRVLGAWIMHFHFPRKDTLSAEIKKKLLVDPFHDSRDFYPVRFIAKNL